MDSTMCNRCLCRLQSKHAWLDKTLAAQKLPQCLFLFLIHSTLRNIQDSLAFLDKSAKRWEQVWGEFPCVNPNCQGAELCICHHWFGLGQLGVLRQWASVSSRLWCLSDLGPILCPLPMAVCHGQPSRATSAGALFAIHKVRAMCSMMWFIVPISVGSRAQIIGLFQDAGGACTC